jgi:hypothetical protein
MASNEAYRIATIEMIPQPIEHEYADYNEPLGFDGNGAPFYKKYYTLTLRCPLDIDGHQWYQWADGELHSIYVPSPGNPDQFAVYSGVYVASVKEGVALKKSGLRGVEMVIRGIQV